MPLRQRTLALAASILVSISVAARAQTMKAVADLEILDNVPDCVPSAPSGYADHKCLITIDRQSPVSPPPVLVPPNTDVFVKVINTRWNEVVLFALATTHTTPPDVAGAAVKNLISPLQSLVFSQTVHLLYEGGEQPQDAVDREQETVKDTLVSLQKEIRHAAGAFTCLSNYQRLHDDDTCSQADLLTPTTFPLAKKAALNAAEIAAKLWMPLADLKDVQTAIDSSIKDCLDAAAKIADAGERAAQRNGCITAGDRHMSNQATLNSAIADMQKAQSALMVVVQTLSDWPGTPDIVAYEFTTSKLNNMVVTITGQEVVNKTNSPMATVSINTQNTNWVISTGILFSNLKYHTFSNAPIIVNGQPVLDPSGKVTTVVTRSDTSPSVVAPQLLVSYRLPWISHFDWENKCRGGCSFLLSGGIGANLTSKSADFDSGFSFQIGSVLFTPTVHFGREDRLSNGVAVGQKLGASPPNPLPTNYQWVKKFGFAITYSLPIP
jgi:hypothetical protein